MTKVAILQSNYIPWKGYFDLINMADLFIFYDDLQYTKNDWRNRNRIKTPGGAEWLTIPCGTDAGRLICEVELTDNRWQKKHYKTICQNYRKAAYFNTYKDFFYTLYMEKAWSNLSDLNQYIIKTIAIDFLSFSTRFDDSRNYSLKHKKGQRVIELLKKLGRGALEYISGPSAKNYLNPAEFENEQIKLTWMDYSGYMEYRQLYPPFIHEVSIIDLLFNEGPNARKYLKSTF